MPGSILFLYKYSQFCREMRILPAIIIYLLFAPACKTPGHTLQVKRKHSLPGSLFYQQAAGMTWKERDSFALLQFLQGNIPRFLLSLQPVNTTYTDSLTGQKHQVVFYVTPDYFSIGVDDDWARVPLTPMTARIIADSLQCILPSRKMVDAIYRAATVRLEPVPMYAFRDSTPTMYHHHLIIEGQRKGRTGLIAGIKKDVVESLKLNAHPKRDRVAIYGWHKPGGKPIQPLYTGHINWYVDYSHGIRFVSRRMRVDGKWMDYREILNHAEFKNLICDEKE